MHRLLVQKEPFMSPTPRRLKKPAEREEEEEEGEEGDEEEKKSIYPEKDFNYNHGSGGRD